MQELDLSAAHLLAPATADVFGKPVDFVYRADLYTPELLRRPDLTAQEAVLQLVTEWGLTRGGEPVPLTMEAILTLPNVIVLRIWDAIAEDFSPNPKWTAPSDSGSTAAEGADAAPSSTP